MHTCLRACMRTCVKVCMYVRLTSACICVYVYGCECVLKTQRSHIVSIGSIRFHMRHADDSHHDMSHLKSNASNTYNM